MTEQTPPTASAGPILVTVLLETPLKRGDSEVSSLQLRRPVSGDLRGLSLVQIGQMNMDELRKLLPRITSPVLIPDEVDRIDLADMMEIAGELGDFLLTKRLKVGSPTK